VLEGRGPSQRTVNRLLTMLIQLTETASPGAMTNSQMLTNAKPPLTGHQRRLFLWDSPPTDQDRIVNPRFVRLAERPIVAGCAF
jgi:hypothetical protein